MFSLHHERTPDILRITTEKKKNLLRFTFSQPKEVKAETAPFQEEEF